MHQILSLVCIHSGLARLSTISETANNSRSVDEVSRVEARTAIISLDRFISRYKIEYGHTRAYIFQLADSTFHIRDVDRVLGKSSD